MPPVDWDAYVTSLLGQGGRKPYGLAPYTPGVPGPPEPEAEGLGGKVMAGLGTALGYAKEKVDVASNYYSNKTLRDRVLSGAPPVPAEVLLKEGLIAPPDPTMSEGEKYARSIGRGLTEGVGRIITDPVAMAMISTGRIPIPGGLVKAAPVLGTRLLPRALQKPMHAGFMAMMAHGMYEGGKHAYAKYRDEGMSPGVAEELAKVGVDAGLLAAPILMRGRGRAPKPEAAEAPLGLPEGRVPRQLGPGGPGALVPRPQPGAPGGAPLTVEVMQPRGPGLLPAPPVVRTPTSGEGLPQPTRLARANLRALPERANQDAHRSLIGEVENKLRIAVAEGNAPEAAKLIKLREGLRESAWQTEPGQAAKLREPYEKPGVVHEVVQQPQNRPRMLEIRAELEKALAEAADPVSKAKVRTALNTLDAQLRQNPMPKLPPIEPPPPPGPPGVPPGAPPAPPGLPPGAPPPAALPAGAPAVPGPPMRPGAPPPGVAPEARLAPSAATMAGAGADPAMRAETAMAATRAPTAALVEQAQARVAGLPEGMPPAMPGAGAAPPVTVEGPVRGIAARAGAPPVPVGAAGLAPVPGAPAGPPPGMPMPLQLPPGAPPAPPPLPPVGAPVRGPMPVAAEPATIASRSQPVPGAEPVGVTPTETPTGRAFRTETGEAKAFDIAPKPQPRPKVTKGVEGLVEDLRALAADRGLTRPEIDALAAKRGLSPAETSAALSEASQAGLLASEMRTRKLPDGSTAKAREFYDPTPFYEPVVKHTKAPRKGRMEEAEWTQDNPRGSLKKGTIDGERSGEKQYGDDWTPEQRRVYEKSMEAVEADPEWFIQEYARRNTKNGQIVINADEARFLFPEYRTQAGRLKYTSSIHEASSWVAKAAYGRALRQATPKHKVPKVFFTAGGPASGKSAIGGLLNGEYSTADILYDGTLAGKTAKTISTGFIPALESGRHVHVGFVSAVNPAKYSIYDLTRGLPAIFGRAMKRAHKSGRPVKVQFFEPAHGPNGAPGRVLSMLEDPGQIRRAWEKKNPDIPFNENAVKIDVLDASEAPLGHTPAGEPIFPKGARMTDELALARLRSIKYEPKEMLDAFQRKAQELVDAGTIPAEVAKQSGIVLPEQAVVGVQRGGLEAGALRPGEGSRGVRGSPAVAPGGVRGRTRGRVSREAQLAQEETALAALFDAPAGRIASADLVKAGMAKGEAVQAIRRLEADGIVTFDRARLNYKLTKKGRAAAAEVGERAPTEPEPPEAPPPKPKRQAKKAPPPKPEPPPEPAPKPAEAVPPAEPTPAGEPIEVAARMLDKGPVRARDLAKATGLKPGEARRVLEEIKSDGEASFNPGKQQYHRPYAKAPKAPEAAPEAAVAEEAPRPGVAKAMVLYKPKKMTAKALARAGGYGDKIITDTIGKDVWHGTGHLLMRAPAPKAGRLVEPKKMGTTIESARKSATVLAEPRGFETDVGGKDVVWLRAGEKDIAVNAKYFGHVARTFPKSEITWFADPTDGAMVAYLGKGLTKPGRNPAALMMPIRVDGKAPTSFEGAGLAKAGGAVRGKPYMTLKEPASMSAEQKTSVAEQIEAAFKAKTKGDIAVRVPDGAEMTLRPETAHRIYKTVTGKEIPGAEKGGFLTDPEGNPLAAMTEVGAAKKLGTVGPTKTVLKPISKTIDMDAIAQAKTIYKDPFHAFDAIERSIKVAEKNKQPVTQGAYEAAAQMRSEAAKALGMDAVPSGGPELAKFEAAALKRVKAARAGIAKKRGYAQADFLGLGTSMKLMRDAIVLGAKALKSGYTSFQPWASEMGRMLGGGWKGLKHLWRWVQSFGAPRTSPETPVPPGPRKARGAEGPPQYSESFREAAKTLRGQEPGIGKKGKVKTPTAEEMAGATKFEGPLRPGEKPKATDYPINVERISTDAGMRAEQHRLAEAIKARLNQNRTHRSWDEARAQAIASGLDKPAFERLVKERGSITDAEMEAGRIIREQLATDYVDKRHAWERAKKSETIRPEEIIRAEEEMLRAAAEWGTMTAHTVAAKSEVARALSILRKFGEGLSPQERLYQQAIKFGMRKGADQRLMDQLADAILAKDNARIAGLAGKIMKPTAMDKINEFFINNILSSPATPAANVLGNWGHENLLRSPERYISGVIEKGAAAREGRVPERLPGEAFQAMKANWQTGFGFSKNFTKIARDTFIENPWDPELSGLKGEFRPPSLPGKFGKVWRTPMRALKSLDKAARSAAYEAEVFARVYREGYNTGRAKGLTGEGLKAHIENSSGKLLKDLSRWREVDINRQLNGQKALSAAEKALYLEPKLHEIGKAAELSARTSTFQDLPGSFTRAALRLRSTHPWLTLFVPFISTPSRIISQALARTPFGLARAGHRAITGKTKGGQRADELARGIWGTMMSAGLYGLAESGFITGSGPTDPRERAVWKKQGKEPYAVKLGDTWVSMARLEPMATVLGLAADLSEAKNQKKAGEVADKLMAAMTNNILSKSYLEGVSGLIEAVEDPERYGATYAKKFIGAATVPNIVAAAARASDPFVRDTTPQESRIPGLGFVAPTVLSRIPGASRTLPKLRHGTGEPVRREESPISTMLSPIRYRREKGEEANLERLMLDVGYVPSRPPKSITIPRSGGRKAPLLQREKEVFSRYMREATKIARRLAGSARFMAADPMYQEKMLKKLFRDARDRAQRIVLPSAIRRLQLGR